MKKIKFLSAFLVLFTAMGLTSCGSDVDSLTGGNLINDDPDFRVTFNDNLYVASSANAVVSEGTTTITGLRGESGEAITMSLQIVATDTLYDNVSISYISGNGSDLVNVNPASGANDGIIVITDINNTDRTISGYFGFRGWDAGDPDSEPTAFFNGAFTNIPYTGDPLPDLTPVTPAGEYYRAKIAGVATELNTSIEATQLLDQYAIIGSNIAKTMDIRVPVDIAPGTYPITDELDSPVILFLDGTEGYHAETGTITIISNGAGWIKGTFAFTGVNIDDETIEVTEGEFNVQLP